MSATSTRLELVPERASNSELCLETLRRTQEELLWYRRMYENVPSVSFSLDIAGTILSINQFGADYLGYAPEELLQKPIFQLFASLDQPRLSDALIGLLGTTPSSKVANGEFRFNCPNSKIKWVKVLARVLLEPERKQNPTIIMVCEDITAYKLEDDVVSTSADFKQVPVSISPSFQEDSFPEHQQYFHTLTDAEGSLDESLKAVQTHFGEMNCLNRLKEEFLSTVSHELRTPLTNMKMAIQMLAIALDQQHNFFADVAKPHTECSKAARYFQILVNECDREINLINNFLDLQRLDTGTKHFVLETIQIQELLVRVVELFKTRYRNRYQHEIHLSVEPNLPLLICDPFSLERILIELLTNACKFSPLGATTTMTAQLEFNNIQFKVINSGVDIPPTELPRIFDKFYRIPSNDPWKQGGMGLGLALVQKLIKHLGGTIKVESEAKCTCFTIELPLSREE
jgi:PAS domain S-box-containing protein